MPDLRNFGAPGLLSTTGRARGSQMDKAAFDPRLESMRGLAALAVAAHHGLSAFAESSTPHPLDWLLSAFNPAASVMFFFVLSGYVLGRALDRDGKISSFLVRRAFRIIPPFVFAVLFAFACVTLIRIDPAPQGLTGFFMKAFWPEPTWSQLWDNLILTSSWVNGPTWSIWPEIVGSAFLPFVASAHKLVPHKWRWLLFLSVSVALAFSGFKLVIWFYFGFFLAKEIANGIGARKWLSVIAFLGGFVLLKVTADHAIYYKSATVIPSAIAGALMIGAVTASRDFMTWLEVGALRFLGQISFSFYLLHWPIFYLSVLAVVSYPALFPFGQFGNIGTMTISIACALCAATVSYRFIELPSLKVGRSVAESIAARHPRPADLSNPPAAVAQIRSGPHV
jgi:peptidoglycan/LPS O-acetylase OafA/YrhL